MSYRELRNFCEIMRSLGYPRLISMENFRKPNFELVADVLYWLTLRYDPRANLSDDIEEERNRVEFIKSVATIFQVKARIKLNTRKLYQADGYAVQEILKIAQMMYNAYYSKGNDDEETNEFSLPSKLSNLKGLKDLANEITDSGAKLFDLLSKENEIKQHREKAINFLENIRSLESNNEQQYIEKCVRDIIAQQTEQIAEMQRLVQFAEKEEKSLEEKIKKRQLDLERTDKRLKTLTNVKPAYMDEYDRLERELEKLYNIYLDKFRNLEYLEHQLDLYNQHEQEKYEESQFALKKMQQRIKEEEMRILRGDQEIDESLLEQQLKEEQFDQGTGKNSKSGDQKDSDRPSQNMKKRNEQQKMMQQQNGFGGQAFGNLQPDDDDQDEDDEPDNDQQGDEEDEDDDVNQPGESESDNEF